jgi:hypothetical protein
MLQDAALEVGAELGLGVARQSTAVLVSCLAQGGVEKRGLANSHPTAWQTKRAERDMSQKIAEALQPVQAARRGTSC